MLVIASLVSTPCDVSFHGSGAAFQGVRAPGMVRERWMPGSADVLNGTSRALRLLLTFHSEPQERARKSGSFAWSGSVGPSTWSHLLGRHTAILPTGCRSRMSAGIPDSRSNTDSPTNRLPTGASSWGCHIRRVRVSRGRFVNQRARRVPLARPVHAL